jgi:hypothetical protein
MSYTPVPTGGIEPPHDGATTRCLPTWLSRQDWSRKQGSNLRLTRRMRPPLYRLSYSAVLGFCASRRFLCCAHVWLPLLGSNQGLRVQSPVPYQLGEGATRLVPRAGFEPAPPDLKDRRPRPLDERGEIGAGSENRTRVFCLESSGSAIELRPRGGWCRDRTCATLRTRRISIALPYRSANHPRLEPSG